MKHRSLIVICGVSGSGKTTVGRLLADHLGLSFFDADDFHPPENIAKMKNGIPLHDDDREGWLTRLNALLTQSAKQGKGIVLACSALKKAYRIQLEQGLNTDLCYVFLTGNFDLISTRMAARNGHFMPAALLQSQFDILELPENGLILDIAEPPETLIKSILEYVND